LSDLTFTSPGFDTPSRRTALIRARPRAGALAGLLLSLLFAVLATPIILAEDLAAPGFTAGQSTPVTVRVPLFADAHTCLPRDASHRGSVVAVRGQILTPELAEKARCIQAAQPSGPAAYLAYLTAMFLIALLYTSHLRSSHVGRLLRTQTVLLAVVLGAAVVMKACLLFTPVSHLIVPVAGIAIAVAAVVDLSAGLATGLLAAALLTCLAPFDAGVLSILSVQAIATVMALGSGARSKTKAMLAGAFGGGAAAIAYVVFFYLSWHEMPLTELETPLHSALVAAGAAGVLAAVLGLGGESALRLALGSVTKAKLVELEDLSNPLLKQIASKSPGTWQHSLAMANMAEIAANEIGANGRLVRVGAYYHDLGKSLQPKYFIENLSGGEASPHDSLDPQTSADAIFAHVTEGVRIGRKNRLPERIIDFMHMHHGDGLLEYFWAKCQESGNPHHLSEADFRYPGVRPDSKETAILAIVDAVEAASRTLKQPEESAIQRLVQRIVYGKLHLGQLDNSGLTAADLRRISNSLIETIKHAHHGRVEYPWQKKENQEREASEAKAPPAGYEDGPEAHSVTSRLAREPRLDSLDAPRPLSSREAARTSNPIELAATERVDRIAEVERTVERDTEPHELKPAALVVDIEPADMQSVEAAVDQAIADEESAPRPLRNPRTTLDIADGGEGLRPAPASSTADALRAGMVTVGPPPATRRKAKDGTDDS